MESTRLAKHIADLERQEAELIAALDRMMEAGRVEITARAAKWIEAQVKRQVEGRALRAQELGIEGLHKLKAQVTELRDRLPAIVADLTSDKKLWPHHRALDDSEGAARARLIRNDEGYLRAVFRDAISELGSILHEYKLLDGGTWRAVVGTDKHRYTIDHGFDPTQAGATFGEYYVAEQRLRHVQQELKKQREALDKALARELWDSA